MRDSQTEDIVNAEVSKPMIFVSYARKDAERVAELCSRLGRAGLQPWLDTEEIKPGEDWERKIMNAINAAPLFLAVLSSNSVDRRGMLQVEIKEALKTWYRKLPDDIYLIPLRLEPCEVPEALAKFQWVDMFARDGFERLVHAIRIQLDRLGVIVSIRLRSHPLELEPDQVLAFLRKYDFYDANANWFGRGIKHVFETIDTESQTLILDHTTQLVWQTSVEQIGVKYSEAADAVKTLKAVGLAGMSQWRLPTLEESMSLVSPLKMRNVHVDPVFGWGTNQMFGKYHTIWTADRCPGGDEHVAVYTVDFNEGCYGRHLVQSGLNAVGVCSRENRVNVLPANKPAGGDA